MAGQDQQTPTEQLAAAGRAGCDRFPHDCSHSVWFVLKKMGIEQQYMVANGLMAFLANRANGWRQVGVAEAG